MSCYCDPSCASINPVPDFKVLFRRTLGILSNTEFELTTIVDSESCVGCYWSLNKTQLEAALCNEDAFTRDSRCSETTFKSTKTTTYNEPTTGKMLFYRTSDEATYFYTTYTPEMNRLVTAPSNPNLLPLLALLVLPIILVVVCVVFYLNERKKSEDEKDIRPAYSETDTTMKDTGHVNLSYVSDTPTLLNRRDSVQQIWVEKMEANFNTILEGINGAGQKSSTLPRMPSDVIDVSRQKSMIDDPPNYKESTHKLVSKVSSNLMKFPSLEERQQQQQDDGIEPVDDDKSFISVI